MIVEFLGISGVGKTTTAKKYFSAKQDEGKNIKWPRYHLYFEMGWLPRNIRKSFAVLSTGITHPKWTRDAIQFFVHMGLGGKNIINMTFNCLSYKWMFNRCDERDCIYLFDEGVFQLIWATYLRSSKAVEAEDVASILKMFQAPDQLIVVTAETSTIKDRLQRRGTYTPLAVEGEKKIDEMKRKEDEIIKCSVEAGLLKPEQIAYYDNNREDKDDRK